MQLYRLIYYS